jgi:hypothetical protein
MWGNVLFNRQACRKALPAIAMVGISLTATGQSAVSGTDASLPVTPATTTPPIGALHIPKVSEPIKLEHFEGMIPSGPAKDMAEATGFIQEEPSDGAKATQITKVYLGYDASNLYVVWLCFDTEPGKIRSHLSRRENIYDDDFVELTLDTFHDQRHGFVFASNPFGVQTDGLWTETGNSNNGPDNSWDTLWYSRGKLTPQGYIVWESIPFRSVRFHRAPEQDWGVTLLRVVARENEWDYWPRVSSRISGRLNQAGTLKGFEDVKPGHNMQFIPYTSFRSYRALDTRDPVNPRFDSSAGEFTGGLDSKFVFHDSLVLDTTINPDFSQVESDEPQNTVNQRFAVFFPEKRPFFLENSNFFDSAQPNTPFQLTQLVFTRRIGDPEFGARLTGKQGPWNLGFLASDDRAPGEAVVPTDPLAGQRAKFAVGRVTYDFGHQSNVGVIYTDREFAGYFNRVGGIDTNLRLGQNWNLTARSVVSSTYERLEDDQFLPYNSPTPTNNQYYFGSATEAMLIGQGRRFEWVTQYQDITPGFRTDTGFLRRNDIRRLNDFFHFYFRPEGKHLVFWGPEIGAEQIIDHTNTEVEYNFNGDIAFVFKRNTVFAPIIGVQSDTLRPQDFFGLPANRKFVEDFAGFVFRTSPIRQFTLNAQVLRQGAVNIVVPDGQLPNEGDNTSINLVNSFKPISQLQIDNTYILDRIVHNSIGRSVYNNHIIRSKWNYQFTKEFSLRFITQYNGLLANPTYSSLTTTKNLNFDVLFTYLLHPGTALYVGYNSNLENVLPGLCVQLPTTNECDPNGNGLVHVNGPLRNDGRVFFVKFSYLFRR